MSHHRCQWSPSREPELLPSPVSKEAMSPLPLLGQYQKKPPIPEGLTKSQSLATSYKNVQVSIKIMCYTNNQEDL